MGNFNDDAKGAGANGVAAGSPVGEVGVIVPNFWSFLLNSESISPLI